MRLKRNTTPEGTCKYALIRLDLLEKELGYVPSVEDIKKSMGDMAKYLELGLPNSEEEFFTIKLKDANADSALEAYAASCAINGNDELAIDVAELASRSSRYNRWCKMPD